MILLLFFCFFARAEGLTPSAEQVIAWAQEKHLDQDKQWLRLVHYRSQFFGGLRSQIQNPEFFNAPRGDQDPRVELEATIRGFFSAQEKTPALGPTACQFPARYLWLQRRLADRKIAWPVYECRGYEHFKNGLAAHSATLVFSSYYLNSPSSAFGHSFLRINKAPSARTGLRYELLDYGINYAAVVSTDNPIVYAYMGLAGLFPGSFTSVPYYYKVREYNDFESRDLWEYDLNLSPEALEMLVAHAWEMGPTRMHYFYLTENCSYHMLSLLDAADPNLNLVSRLKPLDVIPSDTIQLVGATPGLVTAVHYRPSMRSTFQARVAPLSESERQNLHHFISTHEVADLSAGLKDGERVRTLDAAIDYVDYKYAESVLKEEPAALELKHRLLTARSQLAVTTEPLNLTPSPVESPDGGMSSERWGVGGFRFEGQDYLSFGHRFALHDLLDPAYGYPNYAQIDFFKTDFSYGEVDRHLYLEDFTLVQVISNSEIEDFIGSPAWRVRFDIERTRLPVCHQCMAGLTSGGYGVKRTWGDRRPLELGLWLQGILMYSSELQPEHWVPGVGPEVMLRWRLSPSAALLVEDWYRYDYRTSYGTYQDLAVGAQWGPARSPWAIRMQGHFYRDSQQLGLEILFY